MKQGQQGRGTVIRFVTFLLALVALPDAAVAQDYSPSAESTAGLSPAKARRDLRQIFSKERIVERSTFSASYVNGAEPSPQGVAFTLGRGADRTEEIIAWKDIGPLKVSGRDSETKVADGFTFYFGGDEGRRLGDALFVLKRVYTEPPAAHDSNRFEPIAANYRNALPKPEFPEGARRFRVQAEAAVRNKDYEDAADLYDEALKIAPWWPEGRFNRALILGELKEYGEAMVEMKKYLALVPDAPNARAAQDKIYEWEGKARSGR